MKESSQVHKFFWEIVLKLMITVNCKQYIRIQSKIDIKLNKIENSQNVELHQTLLLKTQPVFSTEKPSIFQGIWR